MDYLLIYNKEPIGRLREPVADYQLDVVCGQFVPFAAYEQIRSYFQNSVTGTDTEQASGEMLERIYEQRDHVSCSLSVMTMTGLPIETFWVNINDFSADLDHDGYSAQFCVQYE